MQCIKETEVYMRYLDRDGIESIIYCIVYNCQTTVFELKHTENELM